MSQALWEAIDALRDRLRLVEVAVAVIAVNIGVDLLGLFL